VAIIWRAWAPWTDTSSRDYLRIYIGSFSMLYPHQLYGRGPNTVFGTGAGTLRAMSVRPKWYGTYHFFHTVGSTGRVCRGDSGGPHIAWTGRYDLIAGVHSNSQKTSSVAVCAKDEGKMRGVRLHKKVEWIEDQLGIRCSQYTHNGYRYRKCW
jgi:hypothetical protein